ncbi:anthranilate phosphoribosyltransferase [Chitinophaga nivalis]|uniref:Anthranilate phosphoribosyltransferase n=1 Tax=Chitinophaga nivalis TaxID=2991709 RepID=A0ABT3IFK4_9BACT|nr:anthranilate phosphoribosyltransferase [Chitinophaga nivalis]MCW3467575.1 anthranilate phosphoribosyltransferase [Chitinophaga nivalis]MCW3482733.1 anthranilate phosphoribosyltransferase [Chitinophaga nivalis]
MKKILNYLFEHKTFSRDAAKEILTSISKGVYNESELAAFMTVFLMRSITIDELLGFRDALLELCIPVDLNGYEVLDIVGTGGDAKNTFNISTLSCFIVAGAGGKVAKHGNYGVSSVSGASNLMELVGYKFKNEDAKLKTELEDAGICFLHAPLFHPALKNVAGVRRQLGIRTFFNMLGPLVNPAKAQHQLIGVYSLEMARVYNYLFQQTDKKFVIVHSLDGYDEVSLTADTKVITNAGEQDWTPEQLGKRKVHPEDIYGGNTVEEAAKIFMKILKGEGTWAQNSVVFANAAMGLYSLGKYNTYEECFDAAVASLESGNAYTAFKKLIALQA